MRRKLTADQVVAIAASRATGRALAQRYGVSTRTISEIRTGRRYKSVRRPIQDNSYLEGDALTRIESLTRRFLSDRRDGPALQRGRRHDAAQVPQLAAAHLGRVLPRRGLRRADRLQSQAAPPRPRALQAVRYRRASSASRLDAPTRDRVGQGQQQQPGRQVSDQPARHGRACLPVRRPVDDQDLYTTRDHALCGTCPPKPPPMPAIGAKSGGSTARPTTRIPHRSP